MSLRCNVAVFSTNERERNKAQQRPLKFKFESVNETFVVLFQTAIRDSRIIIMLTSAKICLKTKYLYV